MYGELVKISVRDTIYGELIKTSVRGGQQTAELKGELHHLHSTTADLVQAVADNV